MKIKKNEYDFSLTDLTMEQVVYICQTGASPKKIEKNGSEFSFERITPEMVLSSKTEDFSLVGMTLDNIIKVRSNFTIKRNLRVASDTDMYILYQLQHLDLESFGN